MTVEVKKRVGVIGAVMDKVVVMIGVMVNIRKMKVMFIHASLKIT